MTKPVEFIKTTKVYLKGGELPEHIEAGSSDFKRSDFDTGHLKWLEDNHYVKKQTHEEPEAFVSSVPAEFRKPVEAKVKPKKAVRRASDEEEDLPEISGGIKDAGIQKSDHIEAIAPKPPVNRVDPNLPAAMYFDKPNEMAAAMNKGAGVITPDLPKQGTPVLKDLGTVGESTPIHMAKPKAGKVSVK